MLRMSTLILLGTYLFGLAQAADAPGRSAAPVGSWRGSVVTFDLGSDGRFSYKDPGTAQLAGSWQWLPTTEVAGVLVLTPSAPGSAKVLRFGMTWMNKKTLRFCDVDDHCDTLSRQ
jgi:hypothetical protein